MTALGNRLLKTLSEDEQNWIVERSARTGLKLHQVVEEAGKPVAFVYFVETGFLSVVATSGKSKVEVGLIGREGMSGLSVMLNMPTPSFTTMVQHDGDALRLPVGSFLEILEKSSRLKSLLLQYTYLYSLQTSYTAMSNGVDKLERRLARWLLMAHDRVQSDSFKITHEFLAMMLSVRRSGVTVALHELEGRGLIKSRRSKIEIKDREGMIAMAGTAYGEPERRYDEIIGPA
jgi:CRP-like cAMP-binding protein